MNPTRSKLIPLFIALSAALAPLAAAQFAIPSYSIDAGGGTSSGGSFQLQGTVGQPDASTPLTGGSFAVTGGFWATEPHTCTYAEWAAANIAPGLNASFDGDADQDGISNAMVYVFGEAGAAVLSKGRLTAPPEVVPGDVDLILETSQNVEVWTPVLEYTAGALAELDASVSFSPNGEELIDSAAGERQFYRYRLVLRQ